jgi:hypothetical protein
MTKANTVLNSRKEDKLIQRFNLIRLTSLTPLIQEWLDVEQPIFTAYEKATFDKILAKALSNIEEWSKADLKMKFIASVLELGGLIDDTRMVAYFGQPLSATVEKIRLSVQSDFMLSKGILDSPEKPYTHFQVYRPNKNPTGDSMAQLLEAFLIAQVKNQNGKPLYGVEVVGKQWNFVVMQGKEYCISESYICTKRDDLMQIIAILRKFKAILYERLL